METSIEQAAGVSAAPARLTPLWALKFVYCIGTGSAACLWKFMPVYYHHIGLMNSQIGVIQFLSPSATFVAQLMWAALCDRLGFYKEPVAASAALGMASVSCLLLPQVHEFFPVVCVVVLVAAMLFACRGSVMDSMTLQVLKEYEDAHKAKLRAGQPVSEVRLPSYGQQRLWGALGWGLASVVGGELMDAFGVPFMFASAATMLAATVVVIMTQYPSKRVSRARAGSMGVQFMTRFEVVWFFLNLVIYGLHMALVESFLFVFLIRDFEGATSLLCGTTIAVMTLFEIPVFFYMDRALACVPLTTLLSVCHGVFALRCVAYSVLPRTLPWAVLVIEPLHGLTYAMMWSAAVEYGKRIAPAGAEARMQALLNGLYYQLAMGSGSLLWGMATETSRLGFRPCYRLAACTILAWCFVWNVGWWYSSRSFSCCPRRQQAPAPPLLNAPASQGGELD